MVEDNLYTYEEAFENSDTKGIKNFSGYFMNSDNDIFSYRYRKSNLNQETIDQVRYVRETQHYSYGKLAKIFDTSTQTIRNIINNVDKKDYKKLKHLERSDGYYYVSLFKGGKRFRKVVQHLILEEFIRPRKQDEICCHGPNGKSDNRLQNVSWGTRSKNCGEDKIRDGTDSRGEKNARSKLKDNDIVKIRELHSNGMKQKDIATLYNMSTAAISKIISKKLWKHIT